MKADLHIHSQYSDGKYKVDQIIEFAKAKKLDYIAITDHDIYDGSLYAYDKEDINIILGLELSTTFKGETVHILGYFKRREDILKMKPVLKNQIKLRKERAYKIV